MLIKANHFQKDSQAINYIIMWILRKVRCTDFVRLLSSYYNLSNLDQEGEKRSICKAFLLHISDLKLSLTD
ncbi:hypothetical protein FKM82_017903 [Ascaphus truei]